MSDWSSAVCSSDLVAGAPARCDTSGRGEDRIDQCAHDAPPFVCAWDAPAPRPRGVRDRPATGHRTRRHGPAPDIGCSWVLIRTCRIAPDLMRHFVANYDTFRKSPRRKRDVQMANAERPRDHRDECNSLASETRRVGNECVRKCRSWGSPYHDKKKKKK